MFSVRFLAPAFYRKYIPGVVKDDEPSTVIAAVAANVGCKTSLLTGGRWEVANHPHGRILIGHVKVNESLAEKIHKISGREALFVALLGAGDKSSVAWLPRAKQTSEDYFKQSLTRAQAHGSALVLRQGGGSDLGVVGLSQKEVSTDLVRTWELHGSPKHWTTEEVSDFLSQNKWLQIDVLNKIKRNHQFLWIFKAKAAPAISSPTPEWQWLVVLHWPDQRLASDHCPCAIQSSQSCANWTSCCPPQKMGRSQKSQWNHRCHTDWPHGWQYSSRGRRSCPFSTPWECYPRGQQFGSQSQDPWPWQSLSSSKPGLAVHQSRWHWRLCIPVHRVWNCTATEENTRPGSHGPWSKQIARLPRGTWQHTRQSSNRSGLLTLPKISFSEPI